MTYLDYGKIILVGLYDSPAFLTSHFRREYNKLIEQGYESSEIDFNLRETLSIMKSRIEELYNKDLKTFERFSNADETLSDEKKI